MASIHEEAMKVHDLLADGLNSGAFNVQVYKLG